MTRRGRIALPLAVMASLLAWGGCKGCVESDLNEGSPPAQERAEPPVREGGNAHSDGASADAALSPAGEFIRPINERLFLLGGEEDVENLYPAAVMVSTFAPTEAGVKGRCSGVLMSPRLVLTAGHCVCVPRKATTPGDEDKVIIDGSACAKTALITTVTYTPPKQETGMGASAQARDYRGTVRPHPEFRLLLDKQKRVVSGNADLAVIFLEEPVEDEIPSVQLASTQVEAGELITMVSYGFDEVLGGRDWQRRFIRYKVTSSTAQEGGRIQYEQPGRALYKGDSGGPCLRGSRSHAALVGISSRGLGEEPTFTSTYLYRDWLRSELQRAARPDPLPSHEPP